MQSIRSYPQFRIAETCPAQGSAGGGIKPPAWLVFDRGLPRFKVAEADISETLLLSVFLAILLLASIFSSNFRSDTKGGNADIHAQPVSASALASVLKAKDMLLARLDGRISAKLSNHTHFIAEVIRKSSGKIDRDDAHSMAQLIVKESLRAGYDPLFITSLIRAESSFNPQAVSHRGARGLMQLMPSTAQYISDRRSLQWAGMSKLHDPQYNLRLGLEYLRYLEDYFDGNVELTLVAYNWGPGNLQGALKRGSRIPLETRSYANKILSNHKLWKSDLMLRMAGREALASSSAV